MHPGRHPAVTGATKTRNFVHNGCSVSVSLVTAQLHAIGASMSEPHTSELNGNMCVCVRACVRACVDFLIAKVEFSLQKSTRKLAFIIQV